MNKIVISVLFLKCSGSGIEIYANNKYNQFY